MSFETEIFVLDLLQLSFHRTRGGLVLVRLALLSLKFYYENNARKLRASLMSSYEL